MLGAGSLEEVPSTDDLKPQVQFTLHSMPFTWRDADNDRELDAPDEKQKTYELGAVVTMDLDPGDAPARAKGKKKDKKKGKKKDDADDLRMIVMGDSDMISDKFLRNPGNGYFFVDAVKWLGGEEEYIGETTSEEDVRIMHTRKEDQIWFYLTIFGVPSLILGLGLVYSSRQRRKRS
jgi:ABC-type uncharacterized transport system involved in gliding motility auxiliary subunit